MSWLSNIADKLLGKAKPLVSSKNTVILESDGILYLASGAHVAWADVRQVFAYKDDVVAYDIICIGLRVDDVGTYYVVDEEMSCWDAFLAQLHQRYGIQNDAWWMKVAFPAFARNYTNLWGEELPAWRLSAGIERNK